MAIIAVPWLVTFVMAVVASILIGAVAAGFTVQSLKDLSGWAIVLLAVTVVPSVIVVVITAFYLSQAALIHATSCVYLDREVLVWDAYRFVLNRLGRYFLTSMLFVVVCGALVFFPIIIGAFLFYLSELVLSSGWWSIVTWPLLALVPTYGIIKLLLFDKVVIIENVGYAAALGRSWNLLAGKAQSDWPRGYFLRLVILLHLFSVDQHHHIFVFRDPCFHVWFTYSRMAHPLEDCEPSVQQCGKPRRWHVRFGLSGSLLLRHTQPKGRVRSSNAGADDGTLDGMERIPTLQTTIKRLKLNRFSFIIHPEPAT